MGKTNLFLILSHKCGSLYFSEYSIQSMVLEEFSFLRRILPRWVPHGHPQEDTVPATLPFWCPSFCIEKNCASFSHKRNWLMGLFPKVCYPQSDFNGQLPSDIIWHRCLDHPSVPGTSFIKQLLQQGVSQASLLLQLGFLLLSLLTT